MKIPVLFLIFNRPDLTVRTFNVIREVKPEYLFIAADGPRRGYAGEEILCRQTRELVVNNIDWPCEVKTLLRDDNLGCRVAVSSAINWFFENVDEGIILEDDCLPHPDFFKFCSDMLQYYRDDKSIWQINGTCWHKKLFKNYSFTSYPLIWGWATWKDRWMQYDFEMTKLDEFIESEQITSVSSRKVTQKHFLESFQNCKSGGIDTWDHQWALTVFYHNGICICPDRNLISNIGFGENATHTHDPQTKCACHLLESNGITRLKKKTSASVRVNRAIESACNYGPSRRVVIRRRYYYIKHIIKMFLIKVINKNDKKH